MSAGSNDYLNAISAPAPQVGRELVEAVLGNISTAVYILVDGGATRQVDYEHSSPVCGLVCIANSMPVACKSSSSLAPQLRIWSGTYGLTICDTGTTQAVTRIQALLLSTDGGLCHSFVLPNLPPLQSIPATSRTTLGARAQLAQVSCKCCLRKGHLHFEHKLGQAVQHVCSLKLSTCQWDIVPS